MKILLPLTLVAVAAAFALNTSAGDMLLSPRAQDNQSKIAKDADNSPNTVTRSQNVTASPRTLDNQIKVVKGGDTSPNTIAGGCTLGSPKQLEQAGKFASGNCCKVTSMPCTIPKACCAVASK